MRWWLLSFFSLAFTLIGVLTIALWIRSAWVKDVVICWQGEVHVARIISSDGTLWVSITSTAFDSKLPNALEHRRREPASQIRLKPGAVTWHWGARYGYAADYLTDQRREALQLQTYSTWEQLEDYQRIPEVVAMLNEESLRISRMPSAEYRLVVPLWSIAAGALLLPVTILGVRLKRSRRRKMQLREGLCLTCGYNLTGNVSGVCPECGTAVPPTRLPLSTADGANS